MKKCKECNEWKELSEFYKNGIGGYRPRCKKCENGKKKDFGFKKCKLCGKQFKVNTYQQVYCSSNCRYKDKRIIQETKLSNRDSVKCKFCGKEFKQMVITQKYCSHKCRVKANMAKRSNKPKTKICKYCNKEFIPYTSLDKFCSATCRINNQKSKRKFNYTKDKCDKITGENNPSYRNGMYCRDTKTPPINKREFNKSKIKLKKELIDKKGYLYCENCGCTNSIKYETHHIIFRSEKPNHEHLHDVDNLLYLCISCHNEFHKHKGKRNTIVKNRGLNRIFGDDVLDK